MTHKQNVVLYIDKEIVAKCRELGFNLSRTCENHLKQLISMLSSGNNSCWWAGPDLNRRPLARKAPEISSEDVSELLKRFHDYQIVDLRRNKRTAYEKVWFIKRILKAIRKAPADVTIEDLRAYLKTLDNYSSSYYKNVLQSLKVFYRDFMGLPEIVESFKFPNQPFKPKHILTKEQLRQFYQALETPKEKTLFLLYATTGLRREEILSLKPENVDFSKRMITPNNHHGETKKSWVSFYNEEAEQALKQYLLIKKHTKSERLFPMQRMEMVELWKTARNKTGLDITPQRLREWFCSEMASKGVSDCYIDAFCGRTPKTVLARHYTDYSPEKLEGVYRKADVKMLH